jgi:hypothetical protein
MTSIPIPQADVHAEGEKFQHADHSKWEKIPRRCRDTTEYDMAAADHSVIRLSRMHLSRIVGTTA